MRKTQKNIPTEELVPILKQRMTWTVPEAALVTGINEDRLYKMIKQPGCTFAFNVGKRCVRIDAERFREYIHTAEDIKDVR